MHIHRTLFDIGVLKLITKLELLGHVGRLYVLVGALVFDGSEETIQHADKCVQGVVICSLAFVILREMKMRVFTYYGDITYAIINLMSFSLHYLDVSGTGNYVSEFLLQIARSIPISSPLLRGVYEYLPNMKKLLCVSSLTFTASPNLGTSYVSTEKTQQIIP